ncbi:UHRF1-binding protein 1-like isoform X1 [Actinia tenebrosa]|uniref:UHRF1-binding protein 1-like isoform X1 n=1 Tax=Actinia tenebrosa TaxID=6105 RepID=A0A6P8H0F4_ACTTE|nr:UHRF1-binding protein 1-like isoform X1 [Actinia tenebrosa]
MSSLVKNQIAKQLARFTKNFSPNKISVKFLKGEGELHNLELDEKIISDLLELPPWLRITKAVCNKISAKIHWTKLKTDPICLYLDCVEIDMEEVILTHTNSTSIPPRTPLPPPPPTKEKQPNRYGFVEKVVDGMFVQMNSVNISFKSLQFQASVQISRLIIQSTTPEWKPDDLRNTRIKDEGRGEVLTFKEIHWSTLRIDANAIVPENCKEKSSPIRLITSQSALHITIKKKLEDCSVVSAHLELLLDDILWVLSQSQLQALVTFMNSINKAIEKSGAKKEPTPNGVTPGQTTQQQAPLQYTSSNLQNNPDSDQGSDFSKHDLLETSYHLRTGQIDLHLCDDSNEKDKENGTDSLAGGAMQIHINKLAIDNYPYHLAGTSRTKWVCHNEASLTRAYWVNQLLNTFRNNVKSRKVPTPDGMATRPTRSKAEGTSSTDSPSPPAPARHHPPPPSPNPSHRSTPPSPQHQRIGQTQSQRRPVFMYENCYLVRCEEFSIMPVTTYNAPDEGVAFLSSDKKALYLPSDMPAFQVDYTQYYYPTGITSPVPTPNLFVQLNPVQLTLDTTTCIWFNRFLRTIFSVGDSSCGLQAQQPSRPSHVDIRFEALMPKIVLPCPSEAGCHYRESRPQALQIQISQVALTNSRVGSNSSQTELLMLLQQFSSSKLYTDYNRFPNEFSDVRPLSNLAWLKDFGVVDDPVRIERLMNGLRTDTTGPCKPSQVWCLSADQCWADFMGITNNKNRPMPFIEAIPLRLWVCTPLPKNTPEITPPSPTQSDDEDPRRIPQPSSVASSPGCVRSHLQTSAAIHISNSSPNLKHGSKDVNTLGNRINDIKPKKELGISPPGTSSLPGSPRSRDVGFDPLTDMKRGRHENDFIIGKSFPVASLSKNSQSLSSLSQEELNGGVDSSSHGSDTRNSDGGLDQSIPVAITNNKIDTTISGNENPKDSSRVTNKGPGSSENFPHGGSNTTNEDAPNLRKGFGSYSSNEEENLSDYPMDLPKVADLSALAIIPAHFTVQFDHFQYIFLLRLQESLVKMQEELSAEARRHLSESTSTSDVPSGNVTFSLLAKRGEVSLILPPGPELSNSRGNSSASSYLDPGFVSDGEPALPDVATDGLDTRTDIISPSPKDEQNIPPLNIQSKSSRADLLPFSNGTSGTGQIGRCSTSPMGDPSGWSQDGDKVVTKARRGSDASTSSSLLGTSVESSARSSARSMRSSRIVSIFTAEGTDLHLGIQMEGDDTTVKVTLQDLQVDEKGNHIFEKYLNQKSFKAPHESSTIVPHPLPTSPPSVSVRAEFGPGAERNTPSAGERGFAHVQLANMALSLSMSNMESLSECFDDEILYPKMPFYVELKSSSLCVRDDKPPRLLSAPPPLPLNVNLENISIFRNQEEVIHIKALNPPPGISGAGGSTTEVEEPFRGDLSRSLSRLSRTTSDLSLAESISSRSDNDSERECIKAQLSVSRAALHAVQDERQALLKTIERLQYELAMSNREQDRLQAKVIAYQSGGTAARRKTHQ